MEAKDVTASFHKHVPQHVKKRLNETLSQDNVWNQVKMMYGISEETPCPPDVVSFFLSQVEGSIASFVTVLLKLKEHHREGQQDIPQGLIDEVKDGLRSEMEYNKLRQNKLRFAEELYIDIGRILDYLYHCDVVPDEEIAVLKYSAQENPRDACRRLFERLIASSPEKQPIRNLKYVLRQCQKEHLADELEVSYQDVEDELQKQVERLPWILAPEIARTLRQTSADTGRTHITLNFQLVNNYSTVKEYLVQLKENDVTASFHKHVPTRVKKQLNETLSQDDVWDQVKRLFGISDEAPCPLDVVHFLLSQVQGSIASFIIVLLRLKEGHTAGENIPQYLIEEVKEGLMSEMECNKLREKVIVFAEELSIHIGRILDYLYQFNVIPDEETTKIKNDAKKNPQDACRNLFKTLLATSPKKNPIKHLKAAFRNSGLWYLADELDVSHQDVEDELQKHGLTGSESRSSSLFEVVYPAPLTSTSGQKLGRQQKSMVTSDFWEQFHSLCASGKIPVYRQRVAIVGPYGVGKTHLAKRLIQEKYVEENDAKTPGVKIYRHRCIVQKAGRSCWIRGKDNPEDQFVQNMAIGIQKPKTLGDPVGMVQTPSAESLTDVKGGIFNEMVTKRASSTGDSRSYTSPDRAAAATPDDGGSHASPVQTVEREYFKNIAPELLDKIEKMAQGQPVEPEKQVTIWDFGGQDVYYTTHQTFLSEHIIYLLVFRLDVDLDRKIPVYRGEKTVKEFIMFWLNSIHMHTVERLREEDRDVIPYVLIIGTHKDMLGSQVDVKDIFGKLSKCLDDKQVLKDHVYQYFAINNLAEDDAEFDKIKRVIEKLCGYSSDSKATVQKFSVGWIQLEMDLAKKSEEIPIITVEELCKMAQRVGLSDGELQDSFIPYHHQQGDILHFKVDGLENIVIIDPLWLADVFSAIMTPASSHPGCSYGDILKDELKRGVLKEGVFDEYLKEIKMTENKTEIIQLMLHFDLMLEISQSVENPIPGSGKRRFVVPSMLVSNNNANNALSESDPQKYLLIAFPHIPFPTGLFHRLIIRLLRKYKAQRYENNIPVVGFDRASFRLEDKQSVLHLVVEDKVIKLLITNATGNPPKPHMYANTRKTVEDELSTLRNTYCPRMHFVYCIRIKDDGPNIQIQAQDVQTREVICACLETSEVSIDLRPYRVWFSHEEKEQRRPQSMEEDDLFRDKAFDDKQVYRNYTEWRGKAVIINNISFDNRYYPDRDGTEVDVERLEILFKQLHYLVSKHDNLSAGSINQLAEREARSDHSAYSSFIMVVLSHGSENTVIGTDGYHIGYDQIMAHFEASRCPTLSGKPKMFFISACQSSPVENAAVLDTKPKQATAKQQETPQTPEKADMILVLATTRGDRSWRTPANGTWFIQNLVTELSERARDTHLLDILTQVNQSVSQMTTQEGCRQVSTIAMCTLRKHVYFWPGYYCENGEIKQYPQ